ncbi:uncharacterized protein [Halyomorpha halys]|uniref:uncharacterized protein n=1 Tax=Halyomorpha halys TaxID=286706 RepID=UPI0006D4DBA1|nr:uncharacterized protein LOC106679357 [Halyomorpha halys]XP_014273953.1 uncharacterized protein LOC106679357 [Halyomorpha halys]
MGPKKKKAKDALFMTDEELEELEEAKKRAEQERLEKERLLKEQEEELRREKLEKKKREKYEIKCEEFRNQLLQEHCSEFQKFREEYMDFLIERRREREWQVYISCDHIPFANDPPALNTFLYTWSLIEDQLNMDNVLPESEIILKTIQPVECYIETPLDMKEKTVKSLMEVKLNYYNQVLKNIDKVTFDAIMDVGKYHQQVEPSQIEIYKESENLIIWMWAWSLEGRSQSRPKKKRPEREVPLMSVTLPGILEVKRYHLRIVYTSFDPYSFQSESYHAPQVSGFSDLYDETINIRKREVNALKLRYKNNYDEDIMPWWFMADNEIMEDRAKKEQLKKVKTKKKKGPNIGQTENVVNVDIKQPETTQISSQNTENVCSIVAKKKKKSHDIPSSDDDEDEDEKESIPYRFSKPGSTKIIYSRSFSDLMEERQNECKGPEYFSEVDPIEYLEQSETSSSGATKERYKDLFMAEKHTTFKACMYTGNDCLSDGVILRDINDCLNRSNPSEEKLSFTNKRVFLDWKSFRDISPDREAIRGDLEEILFGNSEMIINNGEVKFVKRDTKLRSIKDLLGHIACTNTTVGNSHKEEQQKETEHTQNIHPIDVPIKVTNVTEMKAVEMEITNYLDIAWQDSMEDYVNKLVISMESGLINLRNMNIIGGVFQFDFFEDEPQPVVNKDLFKTQLHYGEYELKRVLFDQVPQIRIDFAAEAERQVNLAKRQLSLRKMSRITFTAAETNEESESVALGDDDLVWFTLKLPKQIVYFETPVPVRWNTEKMSWTTDDVYDTKWNENTRTCKFKLGKSAPFAISVFKFSNLPYHQFSMKPSSDWKKNPEIELEITTRNFPITFKIKGEYITIGKLDHPGAKDIPHIINVPFSFEELVVAMRSCGIDLFPDWDSFLYINITLKKLKILEIHMYHCMAYSAPAFEYTSSLHNMGSREDRIYVQLRECVDKVVPHPKFRTLLVDPFKVVFVSSEKIGLLVEESDEKIGYMPDLKYLTEIIASKKALRRMKKASKRTIGTLVSLLTATKVLSYT